MAVLHEATITPLKSELITPWLRQQPWWDGQEEREPVGTFRLDDPAGDVGIECFLFGSAAGSTLLVPVTYRAAPFTDGAAGLIGTMEHSVLGSRWVYDACVDPVFMATVLNVIRDGGHEAVLERHRADGVVERPESSAHVRGAGGSEVAVTDPGEPVIAVPQVDYTEVRAGTVRLHVARRVGVDLPAGPALVGDFAGGADLLLATAG